MRRFITVLAFVLCFAFVSSVSDVSANPIIDSLPIPEEFRSKFRFFAMPTETVYDDEINTDGETDDDYEYYDYSEKEPIAVAIEAMTLNERIENLTIRGRLPVAFITDNGYDGDFGFLINERIFLVRDQMLSAMKSVNASGISFAYTVTESYGYVGITLVGEFNFTGVTLNAPATTPQRVIDTINIDTINERLLALPDVLGSNAIAIAEVALTNHVHQNQQDFFRRLPLITSNQSFILSNDDVVLVFGEMTVAPLASGFINITISSENIIEMVLIKDEYYTRSPYNVRMMPMVTVSEAFGYAVFIDDETGYIEVLKDSLSTAFMTLNANLYARGEEAPATGRTLEAAPEMYEGQVFVPISFFTDILGLFYNIDRATGLITFSYYMPNN
jgi:hypothetical protein